MYYSLDAVRNWLGSGGHKKKTPRNKSMCEVCLVNKRAWLFVCRFFHYKTYGFNKRKGVSVSNVFGLVCFSFVSVSFGHSPSCGVLDDFLTQKPDLEKVMLVQTVMPHCFILFFHCKTNAFVNHDGQGNQAVSLGWKQNSCKNGRLRAWLSARACFLLSFVWVF